MLAIRKLEWNLQVVVAGGAVLLLIGSIYYYLLALLLLGPWQLLSAWLNTRSFLRSGARLPILCYWILVVVALALTFLPIILSGSRDEPPYGFLLAGLGLSSLLAIYYLVIYKRLLVHLELKSELEGLLGDA